MQKNKIKAISVMSICAIFLFLKYIAQLFPSLIGSNLMSTYSLSALDLGILASSYYYSYSFMQIVSGWMLDRFNIRLVSGGAILILSLSIFLFARYHSFFLMCLSRVLMGIGASFATVLYMKCAAIWTKPKTFGFVSSLLATATMIGAACGGAPLAYLFQAFSWRHGLFLVALISLIAALMSFIFISDRQSEQAISQPKNTIDFSSIKTIFTNKKNLLLMGYSGLAFSPVIILGGLWGTPFLMLQYHLSTVQVSYLLSIMFIGIAVGAPIWSIIGMYYPHRHTLMQIVNFCSLITICCIIYGTFSFNVDAVWFFTLGFTVGCFMYSFQICREINPAPLLGLAFALMNTGEGIIGSIVEPTIGGILDIQKGNHAAFSIANYHHAFILLPCCFILAAVFLAMLLQTKTLYAAVGDIN